MAKPHTGNLERLIDSYPLLVTNYTRARAELARVQADIDKVDRIMMDRPGPWRESADGGETWRPYSVPGNLRAERENRETEYVAARDALRQASEAILSVQSDAGRNALAELLLALDEDRVTDSVLHSAKIVVQCARADETSDPDDESHLAPSRLAVIFGVASEPLRKRLERFRKGNHEGWIENPDRGAHQAQFLYRVGSVRPIIHALKASG